MILVAMNACWMGLWVGGPFSQSPGAAQQIARPDLVWRWEKDSQFTLLSSDTTESTTDFGERQVRFKAVAAFEMQGVVLRDFAAGSDGQAASENVGPHLRLTVARLKVAHGGPRRAALVLRFGAASLERQGPVVPDHRRVGRRPAGARRPSPGSRAHRRNQAIVGGSQATSTLTAFVVRPNSWTWFSSPC